MLSWIYMQVLLRGETSITEAAVVSTDSLTLSTLEAHSVNVGINEAGQTSFLDVYLCVKDGVCVVVWERQRLCVRATGCESVCDVIERKQRQTYLIHGICRGC